MTGLSGPQFLWNKMENFQKIENRYLQLERNFLKQGRLPMKDTQDGFWSASSSREIYQLFQDLKLSNYNHFLDLGSGDGRVAIIASLFTKSTGIEKDNELHMIAKNIHSELKPKNAKLLNDDFYNYNISKHDAVFISPDTPMHRGLETKFLNELKGILMVYGPHFQPQQLKKIKDLTINGTYVGIYSK
jgi:SAM-dependent methyltransferase